MNNKIDCAIIGAGPAGLTSAIYLARYCRNIRVFNGGHSRASLIPKTHNYPGFPNGISGNDLLSELRRQAEEYGVAISDNDPVTRVGGSVDDFLLTSDSGSIKAKRVLIATGLIDKCLDVPGMKSAVQTNSIRYCPICDGYEAMDKRVVVVGSIENAAGKAKFLRTYSKHVILVSLSDDDSQDETIKDVEASGVIVLRSPLIGIDGGSEPSLVLADGSRKAFDVVYPILGCEVQSRLLAHYGPKHGNAGCLEVDEHQQTSVQGIFAVGDVVSDLHQITVGTGHAAIAATRIHNELPRNFR